MVNEFNVKRYMLLIIAFVMFFSFNIEVKAAKAGRCEYYNSHAKVYIQLKQSENGKFTYNYRTDKNGKWKKKDSNLNIASEPKSELKSVCPTASIFKRGKRYDVNFVHNSMSTGIDYTVAVTDTFAGVFEGRSEPESGTANGGNGKTKIKDSEGNMNCWYRVDDKFYLYMKQDKNGKKSFQYAYVSEKNIAYWKDYKASDGDLKIKDYYSGTAYTSCPNVGTDGKHLSVGHCPADTGHQCASALSYDPVERATKGNGKVSGKSLDELNSELVGEEITTKSCKEILGDDIIEKIQEIVNIIRIMVPILLIVFGIIDFGKAIFVSDENEMKKSQSRFIRRLIIAIGFFMVPSILSIILNIAHNVWDVIPNAENAFCGITF